jgi:hypothetical protein
MADELNRLGDVFARLVRSFVARFDLFATFGAKLIRQSAESGTFDTRLDDATVPGDVAVPYLVGLPGFRVTVPNGVRGAVAFVHGPRAFPPVPHVHGFEAGGAVTEVAFDGGTAPVARVGDAVAAGTISWAYTAPAPPLGVVTFSYTPPGGAPSVFLAITANALVVAPSPLGSLSLVGEITEGCAKLKA